MHLPPRFLLYISGRYGADPFAGYILLDSVHENGVWTLSVVPHLTAPTILVGTSSDHYNAYTIQQSFKDVTGQTIVHRVVRRLTTTARYESTNEPIEVYQILPHSAVIPARQKRNVRIKSLPGTPHGSATPWIDTSNGPSAAGFIEHVSPLPPQRLDPYVAHQLLELAQLKHEMCPIVAEEYITGQTAVMPCGHLFMQMAIEESFKKEANKCPACRRVGSPTFV